MIVYADILVAVNIIVDYFLIETVSKIVKIHANTFRIILGSVIGGISSLYIFVNTSNIFFEIFYRIAVCVLIIFSVFGFLSFKAFLKNSLMLFLVTTAYGGIMFAIWFIFKPKGMLINNSYVYFSISPIVLILSTCAFYIIFSVLFYIFKGQSKTAIPCNINVFADGKSVSFDGILDTGNSVEDVFTSNEVIIVDRECLVRLFGEDDFINDEKIKSRYRMIPCGSVTGESVLEGVRCDYAFVSDKKDKIKLEKPILAISKTSFSDNYKAIVNPDIFLK